MVKYFTQEELAVHNNPENCWVVIFDKVYDISELIMANRGPLSNPLIEAGGSSISHWFNEKTGDLKTYIDPVRNIEMFYTPCGRFIHVPPPDPMDRTEIVALPWWKDTKYIIGQVGVLYPCKVFYFLFPSKQALFTKLYGIDYIQSRLLKRL